MKSPTFVQKKSMGALNQLQVFTELQEFQPVFAGTIPLNIEIPGSDIDVICEITDFSRFQKRLRESYEQHTNFIITENFKSGQYSINCCFDAHDFRIEIYGEKKPILQQNGFLHMIAEAKLLEIGGETVREEIRKLKNQGYKTEPAFAHHFNIIGDPYQELIKLAPLSLDEIKSLLKLTGTPDSKE